MTLDARPLQVVSQYGAGGASSRVRVLDWLKHLGLSARVHEYAGLANSRPATLLRQPLRVVRAEARVRRLTREVSQSTLIVSRQASPFSRGRLEAGLLTNAERGVYDFDDALMVSPEGRVTNKARAWLAAVRAADVVIAGNDFLAARAEEAGARAVVMIPSCVEPSDYVHKKEFQAGSPPTAVWLGSPSTEGYLDLIATPLLRLHQKTGLRLRLISSGQASRGPLDVMVDRVEWRLGLPEETLWRNDLAIMPLPDSRWAQGKCAYKILQYAAAALPVVASPVGANRLALERLGGLSAETEDEWVDAITTILDAAPVARRELGASALQGVEQHYSFSAWAQTWSRTVHG